MILSIAQSTGAFRPTERRVVGAEPVVAPGETLTDVLRGGGLRAYFQPIVDLETHELFGFEALARGPEDSPFARPDRLFAAARAANRLAELDAACQAVAIETAKSCAITSPLTLFVNVEPDTAGLGDVPRLGPDQRGMIELTERALTSRLAELLPFVESVRERGWGIALDDVGADTRSLALMPLLRPDLIKLDLSLVQNQPTPEIAAIAGAVGAQAERTGATVLAEGIETDTQLEYARSLGATLGQGFRFGRPTPEPDLSGATDTPLPIYSSLLPDSWRAPFELASARRPVRRGTSPLLAAISRELERQAATMKRSSVMISSFPDAERWTAHRDEVYEQLATDLAYAAVLAPCIAARPIPGVTGIDIYEDDPLSGTWNVIVISAHFASMLTAEERPREGSAEQQFDFIFTYDRELILECAQALMMRVARLDSL